MDILDRSTKNIANNIKQNKFGTFFSIQKFDRVQTQVLPRKALFNIVNICNANCVFCAYQYKEDKNAIMGEELFDKATFDYARFHPDSYISMTPTVGDPLVDKNVFKKVSIAKANGIKRVQFYTNAILLKKRMDELLNSEMDNIELSLADFDREEYFKIFRVDKYKIVLEGISTLLKKLKERNSTLRVDINLRHRRPLKEILQSADYQEFIRPYLTEYTTISNTDFFDNWLGIIKPKDLLEGMALAPDTKALDHKPCTRLFDMQILQNGDVRICGCRFKTTTFDDLIVGNLYEQSMEEIWFSERSFAIRNGFFSGDFPKACQNCSFYGPIGNKRFYFKDMEKAKQLMA